MKIADLGQLGYLPFQCFDTRYALEVRPAVFGTRIERRWSDSLGRYVQERKSSGDVLCSFLWGVSGSGLPAPGGPAVGGGHTVSGSPNGLATAGGLAGRKIPGWGFAWPAITTGDSTAAPKGDDDVNAYGSSSPAPGSPNFGGGFGGIPQTQEKPKAAEAKGSVAVVPVYDTGWTPDTRFSTKTIVTPPGIGNVPAGTVGIALAGTRELSQEELFLPLGVSQPLVATHHGGDFWRSTHVHDLTAENKLDQVMKAKLHQLLRVYEIPKHCGADTQASVGPLGRPGNHSLALQMGTARGGIPGNLLFADDRWLGSPDPAVQDHGVATNRLSGPLSVGTCTKHLYRPDDPANTKGERFRPLHFDPNAYWDMRHYGCGPLEFTRVPYPRNAKDNGVPTRVYLSYDAIEPHGFLCGQRLGVWRWWTMTPLYKPGTGRQSVPGEEEGFLTKPGSAADPFWTIPGDANDEGGGSTPGTDPDVTYADSDPGIDTAPDADQHFTTNPEREAFQSQPGTLGDPGTNASHEVRDIGVPGITDPDKDPWIDGPGQPGAAPGVAPVGFQTFGFRFLEPITPAAAQGFPGVQAVRELPPPSDFNASQTARARAGVALDYLAIPNELGVSGLVLRAQPVAPGIPSYQNVLEWGPDAAAYVDSISPSVLRLEPFAKALGGKPVYANELGQGRYGPEASGGLVVYPPSIGGEQIYDGLSPSSRAQAAFILYAGANARVDLSLGTPCYDTGSIKSGYRIRLSADGRSLTFDKANASCAFAEVPPFVIDDTTEEVRVYGEVVMTGTSGGGSTPKGYIYGFGISQPDWAGSPSTIDVEAGICRDTTNSYDINVGDPSTDYLSAIGPLGNDSFSSSETALTATIVNAGTIVTCTFTASLLITGLDSVARVLSGTINKAAPDAASVAVLTGTGTAFLSELKPGDLVGEPTFGYGCVLAVDSDTTAYIYTLDGSARTGVTYYCWENFQIQVGGSTTAAQFVAGLSADGLTATCFRNLNAGADASGLAVRIGKASKGGTTWTSSAARTFTLGSWLFLWARRKTDGTATLSWSTQRTEPYTPGSLTGYSIWRRVGVIPIHTDGFVPPLTQIDYGSERLYRYECSSAQYNFLEITATAGAGSWTTKWVGYSVSPVSTRAEFAFAISAPGGTRTMYLRPSGAGSTATSRPISLSAVTNTINSMILDLGVSENQSIDHLGTASSGEWTLVTVGYYDKP